MKVWILSFALLSVSSGAATYSPNDGQSPPGTFTSKSQDEVGVEKEETSQDELRVTRENKDLIQNVPRDETIEAQEEDSLDYSTTREKRFRQQDSVE
jgi:hypothetical protein